MLFPTVYAIYEEAGISMTIFLRRREPLVGSIRILLNTFAHEVQLPQQILCVGVSVIRGLPQVFRRSRSVF